MRNSITLKTLTLKNFKGVRSLTVNFNQDTFIYGDNGTGKTSVFDAFTWLLFDKDSKDRKSFEIKTLNSNNETTPGLEHQVSGLMVVDGKEISLRKLHREKWCKKKGQVARVFSGNETLYYIDELPVKQSEYVSKVNSIIDENIFKLITNPLYFSTSLKWQQRREVILQIIGDISSRDIFKYKSGLVPLEKLLFDKDIDTLRKSLAVRKKKLNDDLKAIPYRIDEINNSIEEVDTAAAEEAVNKYTAELNLLEEQIFESCSSQERWMKEQERLYRLKEKKAVMELEAKKAAQKPLTDLYDNLNLAQREATALEGRLNRLDIQIFKVEDELSETEKAIRALEALWMNTSEEVLVIPEEGFVCEKCGRPFEAEDIKAKKLHLYQEASRKKNKTLADYESGIKGKKDRLMYIQKELEELRLQQSSLKESLAHSLENLAEIKNGIDNFNPEPMLLKDEAFNAVVVEIEQLESDLAETFKAKVEVEALQQRRKELLLLINAENKKLESKELNLKFRARIEELLLQQKVLTAQIAELEGQELLCEDYIRTKVELLEKGINEKFKYVRFKLFNVLMNGTVEECCEALIDGVPFGSANTAGQINAGIDIINALSQHYGVYAPVFIDNRESINRIIHCPSQMINLIVSKDERLRVE
jgi:chromosome segregation ATPase